MRKLISDAIENGQIDELVQLLSRHPELIEAKDSWSRTPLGHACEIASLAAVKALCELGADIENETDGNMPILAAVENDFGSAELEVVKCLAERGASVFALTTGIETLMDWACVSRNLDAIHYLISCGMEINHRNGRGETCIWMLIHGGPDDDLVEWFGILLDLGLDPTIKNNEGKTAAETMSIWAFSDDIAYRLLKVAEMGNWPPNKNENGK